MTESPLTFESKVLTMLATLDKGLAVLESRTANLGQLSDRVHALELQLTEMRSDLRNAKLDDEKLHALEKKIQAFDANEVADLKRRVANLESTASIDSGTRKNLLVLLRWAIPSGSALLALAALVYAVATRAPS